MEFRMAVQIIDNFLEKEKFNRLSDTIMGDSFPWFYNDGITNDKDKDKFYFTHMIYRQPNVQSNWFNMCLPIIEKLECKSIIRIKANSYFSCDKTKKNQPHIDYSYKHKGCLLYINDNNGATYFKEKTVVPKANRAVLFDPSIPHSSSLCDDQKRRVTVNFNYF